MTMGMLIGLLAATQGSVALGAIRWGEAVLRQQPEWYGSAEARAVADSVMQYQSPQGGWPKSTDLATPPRTPDDGTVRFRFCPKAAKTYNFTIRSNVPALNGKTGGITSFVPPPYVAQHPSSQLPNWYTDNPSKDVAEGKHIGAKTVSRWREDFLRDFAARMQRCASPASK